MEQDRKFIYEEYIDVTEDGDGALQSIEFKNYDKFNFAFDIVDKLAQQQPDKLAMLHIAKNKRKRELTFEDMSKYSSKAAAYFQSLGIRKGDRVMLVLKRHYQFWFAILGLHKLGAVAIPATNLMKQHDFEYRFEAAGVKAIVCTADDNVAYQVELALENTSSDIIKIIVRGKRDGWDSFDRGIQQFDDPFVPEEYAGGDDPSIMFFTSGTTGYPKIATHTFKYPLGHFITAKYWHQVDPDGIHFTISDTGWGKALWGKLYGQWLCEAPVFTYDMDSFDAGEIMDMIGRYKITTFCAPPTVYRMMIKKDFSKYDFSALKHATTAGEALNAEVFNQFKSVTGLSLHEGFGQTEMTLAIGTLKGTEPKAGSMGKPTPMYDIDLLGEDGKPAKTGETGEIVVRTKNGAPVGLFDGYYRSEEMTRQAWHDGIYHTGDTAWRDEDGYFWYVGRDDDVIKSAGYRIGPFEIESVLMELPYVLECGVTSVHAKIRGQVIKACIVLIDGVEGTDDLKKEIQRYARKKMASYKYPRIIEFWEELPKTISGKIQHNKL
ncbi:AMP-binding protein [Anaerovorax odorimutans]|uniref:AMP-binding protein n=1 Tax=Anaerovorax odorimutans TaxID=109327 RepID=A0ABT1RQB0_9FIRM|nr:AMP-binding protein [Anaerovorax odorimutans]MCQ4637351.1 AMP-binding protein [Anaerovorax odorimutans]